VSGDLPLIALPDSTRPLLEAARTVLATPDLPPVVLIGGLAVTMRVSSAGAAHRATVDIDLVTVDAEPEAVEVLADAHATPKQPLIIGEVKVDVIATSPITDHDLKGLDDQNRLFVAAHRWAFESGRPSRMTTTGSEPFDALVASTASLVATKCHAIGFPTSRRRSTKHASDLLDLFRLVQLHNRGDDLSRELRDGPAELARIVADIAEREVVATSPSATRQMSGAAREELDVDEVRGVIGDFVDGLRG
jgi:hypothetical protein